MCMFWRGRSPAGTKYEVQPRPTGFPPAFSIEGMLVSTHLSGTVASGVLVDNIEALCKNGGAL